MPTDSPKTLRLGVLDQSPITAGSTGSEALHNSIDLARRAEHLGFHRYWVAEHHGTTSLACASPEALIGPIAAITSRIHVGSGGVMLPHYSPLKVAETFSLFSGLFPGRIDLGIGRAPGSDQLTSFALQRDRRQQSPDDFPSQLAELLAYLNDRLPPDHPFARLGKLPGRPESPGVWLLGSSPQSGLWASEVGVPYVFADFINPHGAEYAQRYREEFTPSLNRETPYVVVCSTAICAETDEAANILASSSRMAHIQRRTGHPGPLQPVDVAMKFIEENGGWSQANLGGRRLIVGSPETVRAGIEVVAAEYGADEMLILTNTHSHEARRRSYELIAGVFGLHEESADADNA